MCLIALVVLILLLPVLVPDALVTLNLMLKLLIASIVLHLEREVSLRPAMQHVDRDQKHPNHPCVAAMWHAALFRLGCFALCNSNLILRGGELCLQPHRSLLRLLRCHLHSLQLLLQAAHGGIEAGYLDNRIAGVRDGLCSLYNCMFHGSL